MANPAGFIHLRNANMHYSSVSRNHTAPNPDSAPAFPRRYLAHSLSVVSFVVFNRTVGNMGPDLPKIGGFRCYPNGDSSRIRFECQMRHAYCCSGTIQDKSMSGARTLRRRQRIPCECDIRSAAALNRAGGALPTLPFQSLTHTLASTNSHVFHATTSLMDYTDLMVDTPRTSLSRTSRHEFNRPVQLFHHRA